MNAHYEAAIEALKELKALHPAGAHVSEAAALAAVSIQASLAAAKATDDLLKAQETANLIAYAQLSRQRRRVSLNVEKLIDERMAELDPAAREDLTEAEDGF